MLRRCVALWASVGLRAAWQRWGAQWSLCCLFRRAAAAWLQRELCPAFERWRGAAVAELAAKSLVTSAQPHAAKASLAESMRRWRRAHAKLALFARVAAQWRLRPVAAHLRCWLEHAKLQAAAQGLARRVLDRLMRVGVDAAMVALKQNAAVGRGRQELQARREARQTADALRALRSTSAVSSAHASQLQHALGAWRNRGMSASWRAWVEAAAVSRANRARVMDALDVWVRRGLGRVFGLWSSAAAERGDAKWRGTQVALQLTGASLRRRWQRWRVRHAVACALSDVAALFGGSATQTLRRLRAATRRWRCALLEERHDARRAAVATWRSHVATRGHRSLARIGRAVDAWQQSPIRHSIEDANRSIGWLGQRVSQRPRQLPPMSPLVEAGQHRPLHEEDVMLFSAGEADAEMARVSQQIGELLSRARAGLGDSEGLETRHRDDELEEEEDAEEDGDDDDADARYALLASWVRWAAHGAEARRRGLARRAGRHLQLQRAVRSWQLALPTRLRGHSGACGDALERWRGYLHVSRAAQPTRTAEAVELLRWRLLAAVDWRRGQSAASLRCRLALLLHRWRSAAPPALLVLLCWRAATQPRSRGGLRPLGQQGLMIMPGSMGIRA